MGAAPPSVPALAAPSSGRPGHPDAVAPSTWLRKVQDQLADKHPAAQIAWRMVLAGVVLAFVGAVLAVLASAAGTTSPAPSILL